MAGVTSWRLVGVPAPLVSALVRSWRVAPGGHGATSRILTTLTESSRLVPGRLQGFCHQSGGTARPTVARWCDRPVACPWGRVGRRAWALGLSSPTCDPPRSGRWASTVPGDGPVWAPGVRAPRGVAFRRRFSKRRRAYRGHRDRSRSGHRCGTPVPDGPVGWLARIRAGRRPGIAACRRGGRSVGAVSNRTTAIRAVGRRVLVRRIRGTRGRRAYRWPGAGRRWGVHWRSWCRAFRLVWAGSARGPGTSVPGPERGGFSCRCSPVRTGPGRRCRQGWRRPGPGRGCRSWGRL